MLAGNGNFLERILGLTVCYGSDLLVELRSVVQRALSRRVHRHYRGFALNQLQFLEKEPTAKKLLYVLRTTLTGIHLLETGELEPDLTRLMDAYGGRRRRVRRAEERGRARRPRPHADRSVASASRRAPGEARCGTRGEPLAGRATERRRGGGLAAPGAARSVRVSAGR